MSIERNEANKSEGVAEKIGGTIKKVAGKLVGDEQLEAEGTARELKGEARVEGAKAGERAEGAVDEAIGAIKNRVGALVGDDKMQAEGKVREVTGELRQKTNK